MYEGHDEFQTDDNWNIDKFRVTAYRAGVNPTIHCVFSASGHPLERFSKSRGFAWVTNFPNAC